MSEPAPPHVAIRGGILLVDGEPFYPFGGELQYFRVRDRAFDGARTHELWAERLGQLRAAGMNTISTYVPWDYHAPADGIYDWAGARDLHRFLELAVERGFKLIVKPGPFILAEWPYGFGSYGAVPLWWKRAHRDALVRDRRGKVFGWHPVAPRLSGFSRSLPSYASAELHDAAAAWFEAVLPQFREWIGPGKPVIAVQLDNETNLFWSDIYRIDHHRAALTRFRALLADRYGSVDRLSAVYGQRYKSFDRVQPPRDGAHGPDARQRDWVDHLQALVCDYLGVLRAAWEGLGVREPDVLFLTNDTPQTFSVRDLLLPHGPTKTRHGIYCLDTYPRGLPLPSDGLFDTPYEPEFGAKLQARWNRDRAGGEPFSFGIEIQGGHFAIPLPLGFTVSPHTVLPEATRQTLLRLHAHGMQGIVLYTAVGGINLDGSDYDFQAALGYDGEVRPRLDEARWFARFLSGHAAALRRSRPVESSVAIAFDGAEMGPGYGHAGEQRIFGAVLRGLFGWCAQAGITPAVTDVSLCDLDELRRYDAVVLPTSGAMPERVASLLEDYVRGGGHLVQLLSPGPLARSLFPAAAREGKPPWRSRLGGWLRSTGLVRGTELRFELERAAGSFEASLGEAPVYETPGDAECIVHPLNASELALGYARAYGEGRASFLSFSPGDRFTSSALFTGSPRDLPALTLFLRRLLRPAGVVRLFACGPLEEAHARRDPETGALFVYVLSSHDAGKVHVRLRALEALGLEREGRYELADVYRDAEPRVLGRSTGAELRETGITVELARYGATVVRVAPAADPPPVEEEA